MGYALWFSIFQYTIGSTVLLLIATASERQLTKFNLDPGCSLHEVCTFSQWPSRFTPGDPSFISHPKDIRAGALFDHCKLTLVSWWKYGIDVGWVSNKWSVRTCWATGLVSVLHLSRILGFWGQMKVKTWTEGRSPDPWICQKLRGRQKLHPRHLDWRALS